MQQEGLEGGDIVQPPTHTHHMAQFSIGQVLVKHGKIVAEIEESLPGIALWQGAASHVVDQTLGQAIKLSATGAKSPAEVYFLVMGKKASIQPVRSPIVAGANHHASARGPEHLSGHIVLAMVFFHRVKYPPPAKGIAIPVHEPTTGPGVLKGRMVPLREQLGLAGGHLGMALHETEQGSEPARSHRHV